MKEWMIVILFSIAGGDCIAAAALVTWLCSMVIG